MLPILLKYLNPIDFQVWLVLTITIQVCIQVAGSANPVVARQKILPDSEGFVWPKYIWQAMVPRPVKAKIAPLSPRNLVPVVVLCFIFGSFFVISSEPFKSKDDLLILILFLIWLSMAIGCTFLEGKLLGLDAIERLYIIKNTVFLVSLSSILIIATVFQSLILLICSQIFTLCILAICIAAFIKGTKKDIQNTSSAQGVVILLSAIEAIVLNYIFLYLPFYLYKKNIESDNEYFLLSMRIAQIIFPLIFMPITQNISRIYDAGESLFVVLREQVKNIIDLYLRLVPFLLLAIMALASLSVFDIIPNDISWLVIGVIIYRFTFPLLLFTNLGNIPIGLILSFPFLFVFLLHSFVSYFLFAVVFAALVSILFLQFMSAGVRRL